MALHYRHDFPEALLSWAHALMLMGSAAEGEQKLRAALTLRPDYAEAQSSLVYYSSLREDRSAECILREAREYGQMLAARLPPCERRSRRQSEPRRLRVGMVSGDLHSHPVGRYLAATLAHLDADRIELIAYSNHYRDDETTARLRSRFAAWRDIHGLRDALAARKISDDAPHVLIDLSGHTGYHRLPLFARRLAPVQASWLGYCASTGVTQMDFVIADPHVAPRDVESHFVEKIWRLPETYLCLEPPDAIAVAPLPALSGNCFVFGSFNDLIKMNDAVVAVWSRIMRSVPQAVLFLKTARLAQAEAIDATRKRFAAHGIDADRLVLEGPSSRAELLAAYGRVDVALDPFPYPGGTTSIEALWMGVPVLTRAGQRFLSRVGVTIARNARLDDWIACDDDDYVSKAVRAASQPADLAALRAGLRDRVMNSPLFDAPRFARHFEDALWGMWRERSAVA